MPRVLMKSQTGSSIGVMSSAMILARNVTGIARIPPATAVKMLQPTVRS
jgi:hypothetical protein